VTPRERHLVLACACGLAMASSASAAEPTDALDQLELAPEDYDVGNPAWNGLSTFAELAAGAGYEVISARRLDWARVRTKDLIVVLYPVHELDATNVNRFVQAGGRLVVGDDFGDSSKFLGRLHMLREPALGVRPRGFWDDLPHAPIARPRDPTHPLARGVAELVTNHPAVLTEVGGAQIVFEFGAGEAVLVAGGFGDGRFAVLSDPSVLINAMLQFPGNFELALNLLRYFGPRGDGRVIILTGAFRLTGEPSGLDDDSLRGTVAGSVRGLNSWLDELNDWVLDQGAIRVLAVIGALALALLAAVALPPRRAAALDGSWLRARPQAEPSGGLAALLARCEAPTYRGSFAAPAAALRDAVDALLARALGEPALLSAERQATLYARVEARYGRAARAAVAAVTPRLARLPGAGPSPGGPEPFVSRREFERLARDVAALERALSATAGAPSEET
jgi:hypothetical protein